MNSLYWRVQSLTALTANDFKKLYLSVIDRFTDFLKEYKREKDPAIVNITDQLAQAILALKRRRAFLLPIGAESEVTFGEREEWTYAIFIVGLLKGLKVSSKFDLAQKMMPEAGFLWLERNSGLFALWKGYLSGENTQTIFSVILEEIVVPEEMVLIENAEVVEAKVEKIASDLKPCSRKALSQLDAESFFQWLKEGIENQVIPVNAPKGIVHRVKEGLFIIMPLAMNQYIQYYYKGLSSVENSIKHLMDLHERVVFTTAIEKYEKLTRDESGSLKHRYCLGSWQNREVLTGLVIKIEDFLDPEIDIPVHPQLSIDPFPVS